MGDGAGISESEWVAQVRGLDVNKAWHVLESDGRRLVRIDARSAEEILVRFWGTWHAMVRNPEPHFLSALRNAVARRSTSGLPDLPRAVASAAGWISSRELLAASRVGTRTGSTSDRSEYEVRADQIIRAQADPWLVEVWQQLYLLMQLEFTDRIELDGVRGRLTELASSQAAAWMELLPWILSLDGSAQGFVGDLTQELLFTHPDLIDRVRRYETHLYAKVALRATGLVQRSKGVGAGDWAVEVAAARLDGRRDVYPRPLAAPAATWLADPDLEEIIRGAAGVAISEFRPIAESQGGAEEEGLTSALLASLRTAFKEVARTLQVTTNRRTTAPGVRLSQRVVSKKEESRLRADVCVLVSVELAGDLKIRFGDLVQVKKSGLFANRGAHHETWRIDVQQLRELLKLSGTAVYWLIRSDGDVLVVPGKVLLGIVAETAQPEATSRTIRYSEIRHAAVGLGSYLCDLLMGMWLGTADSAMICTLDGTDALTSPLAILEVAVVSQLG
ncbi:hypothetical protein ACFWUU_05430 [Kribbella sp. NPDC058693]|uniref:hypothetical protein n=1 Tax=Kribbella sp. NPDC058693 TaxID=3346602 RepID=UPI00364CF845